MKTLRFSSIALLMSGLIISSTCLGWNAPDHNLTTPDPVVIGYIKQKSKIVTIKLGPAGILYTVSTEDGSVLAKDLPPRRLFVQFPELKKTVKNGIAANDASLGPHYINPDFAIYQNK